MNMMGKRVNFACRSVITPDPYLDIDEIGIPELFAKKLTVTETANAMNLAKLRKMIKNGPGLHPGYKLLLLFENTWEIIHLLKSCRKFLLSSVIFYIWDFFSANFIQKPGRYTQVLSTNKANERDAAAKRLQPGSSSQLGYPIQVIFVNCVLC